ncbi:MAG: hypothetical protein ACP5UC_01430 [Candidatus Micrarchaeia archaeon]
MDGEIAYLFMFDAGTSFTEEQLAGLLKNQEDFSKYEYTKPSPEEISTFNVPIIFNLKEEMLTQGESQQKFKVQAALYRFGGISIRIRYQITDTNYGQIVKVTFDKQVSAFVQGVLAKTRKKIEAALSKIAKISISQTSEAYRFYYIDGDKPQILGKYKKVIAGLMIDEQEAEALDDSYVDNLISKGFSYDNKNIFFAGWESAVLIDKEYAHEHELLIAEIANLQLLEMRIYHDKLTKQIESSSKYIELFPKSGIGRYIIDSKTRELNKSLGNLYDSTRTMLNSINDMVFGTGEWYLSRVYSTFVYAFKLDEWKEIIEKDLEAISREREFVADLIKFDYDVLLEYIIILLIVIEIIVEVFYMLKV